LAPLIGVVVNAALALLKIVAGVFGNSQALVADGIESTTDIFTSLVVWAGLRVAARPPDDRHPYGYGKAEALAGVIAAVFLLAAGAFIAYQSIHEILTPHHLPHWSTLVVLAGVIVIKEALARWVLKKAVDVNSSSLQSDAWHHRSDALTSAAAFIGISIGLVGGKGYEAADDWAALLACLVIGYTGIRLLKLAVRDLLDVAPTPEFEQDVRTIALDVPGVRAIEKCRIRKSGLTYFVDIHVQVDGNTPVRAAHQIAGQVRSALRESPHRIADAVVHIEPFEPDGHDRV
jgi:cation diffusion facilitator family transporter